MSATSRRPRARQNRDDRVLGSGRQTKRHGPATRIDEGRQFSVQSTLGVPHRLGRLSSPGIGSMLMQLDVRAIQMPQLALRVLGQDPEPLGEKAAGTPAPIARIDRGPRSVALRQISPSDARSQPQKNPSEHQTLVLGRPTTRAPGWANLPSPLFSARIRSIFLAASTAAPELSDDLYRTCSASDSASFAQFLHFANTPQ